MRVDPFAISEPPKESAVEAAGGSVIDVLYAGLLAQSGVSQSGGGPEGAVAAGLFQKKCDAGGPNLIAQIAHPVGMHWPRAVADT